MALRGSLGLLARNGEFPPITVLCLLLCCEFISKYFINYVNAKVPKRSSHFTRKDLQNLFVHSSFSGLFVDLLLYDGPGLSPPPLPRLYSAIQNIICKDWT